MLFEHRYAGSSAVRQDENATGLGLSKFHFWRGSLGVSFKF